MPTSDRTTGVYQWRNSVDGKVYVGGAYASLKVRERRHRSLLRGNKHFNKHFQNAWNKYGPKAFTFSVLEQCPVEDVAERETYWIDKLNATDPDYGYNISPTGGSTLGIRYSDEDRKRMAAARVGMIRKPHTQATKDKMSAAKKGKPGPRTGAVLSNKTKAKISASKLGSKMSDDAKANMSIARKGKKQTEEHRLNSKANHWSKGPNAEAIGAKISNGLSGKKHTEEFKRKMSETKLRQAAEKREAKRLESIGSNGGGTLFD